MASEPKFKPEPAVDPAAENVTLKAKVAILESELKDRDQAIADLRGVTKKPKLRKLDSTDRFGRPYAGG